MPKPIPAPITAQPQPPPDQATRNRALDPTSSFLVQAPAGSGKTYLLTQRFLRLLAEASRPDEIVAITFTNASAAEMQNRILNALENAAESSATLPQEDEDTHSLPALARRVLARSSQLNWQLLDQPGQLRITTIDAFCRGLAQQSPLSWGVLSSLGGRLDMADRPGQLYKQAALRTLELLRVEESPVRPSVEALLLWRDNNWSDVEDLIVKMLAQRNRWFQEFVFARSGDWPALRTRLEGPLRRRVIASLRHLCGKLNALDGCLDHALHLARRCCEAPGKFSPKDLAERAEMLSVFSPSIEDHLLLDAASAYRELAVFLLTKEGTWRKRFTLHEGCPSDNKALKNSMAEFMAALAQEPGLEAALAAFREPMPTAYTDDEWEIVRHCFAVLSNAAAALQVVFAEAGKVDFTEVAQIALRILEPVNGYPSDFALRQADSIHHLLVDEFQDTSRNQHQLLARLISAWPDTAGRSCFCVGDPMQSIYGFREAEVELFERLKTHGLELSHTPDAAPFLFEFLQLEANFRTAPTLVEDLNSRFASIFTGQDFGGQNSSHSGIRFAPARPMRPQLSDARVELHFDFARASRSGDGPGDPELAREAQLAAMVALVRERLQAAEHEQPDPASRRYRIAVLGRTRAALVRVAEALDEARIGYRAVDLVELRERQEILDALALIRTLFNPVDRTAWLGVLRAPWCGLSLEELHLITSADDAAVLDTPVLELLVTRAPQLHARGQLSHRALAACARVAEAISRAIANRGEAATASTGTWIESIWKALGGEHTVNAEERQNLNRLWMALDALPQGQLDLVGPGLTAALEGLYALPDPDAGSESGVQLMTIHKSKGLEFEMVIVPELESGTNRGDRAMISWLERGLTGSVDEPENESDAGPDEHLTEFLIAPIASKGMDAGAARQWVDAVKRQREQQELERVLYVAATRAREELHLFARPGFRAAKDGEAASLAKPCGLLATAWPAIADETETLFANWISETAAHQGEIETLAAQTGSTAAPTAQLLAFPAPLRATRMRRLPADYSAPLQRRLAAVRNGSGPGAGADYDDAAGTARKALYARTEGGLRSRLEGIAIHTLMERMARLRLDLDHDGAVGQLAQAMPGIVATLRGRGLALPAAQALAAEALAAVVRTMRHPAGAWIVSPHAHAEVEARWTGLVVPADAGTAGVAAAAQLRNLRPDRVFHAAHPDDNGLQTGQPVWWIIDYKTSHAAAAQVGDQQRREEFFRIHRAQHIEQLQAYAQLLRGLQLRDLQPRELNRNSVQPPGLEIRAGIYYPRLDLFDHWQA